MKKLISAVTAAILLVTQGVSATSLKFDSSKIWNNMVWIIYGTHDGSGNPARNFKMKNEYGKTLSYTLVETFAEDDAKYWIIANDRYGTKGIGASPKYSPTVEGSIGKYVNETFLQDSAGEWKFPESVIECLDTDHEWWTEKAFTGEIVTEAYKINAAVVIPAVWEFEQYGENIMINFPTQSNANYVFRTPYSDGYLHGLKLNSVTESDDKYKFQLTPLGVGSVGRGIRPEFFVNKDFFKTAVIDLSTAGSDIIAEVEKYSYEELSKLYADEEIKLYLPSIDVPEPIATVRISTTDGKKPDVGNTVEAVVGGEAVKTEEPVYKWYADDILLEGENGSELILGYNHYQKNVYCEITIAGVTIKSNSMSVGGNFMPTTYANMSWVSIGANNGEGNDDYDFEVDGKNFTLVDTYNNTKSKYMVIANDLYGSEKMGQTRAVYNPEEKGSFAEYVNDTVAKTLLPKAISEHIDFEHVWITEKQHTLSDEPNGNDITVPYTTKAGVVVPAIWEMVKFADKIKIKCGNVYSQFVFRTPYNLTHYHALSVEETEQLQLVGSNYRWKLVPRNVTGSNAIRPMFFLDSSFFKDTKFNLAKTGAEIKKIIKEECSREELLAMYSESELIEAGFGANYSVDVLWTDGLDGITSLNGVSKIQADISIASQMSDSRDMVLIMEVFDEDNNIVGMDALSVTAVANQTTYPEKSLTVGSLSGVTDEYTVKIFIWDSIAGMKKIKNAVVFGE